MKQRIVSLVLAVLMLAAILTGCAASGGTAKNITVTAVYADGSEEAFNISTEKETLGDALLEQKLINDADHASGMVTTFNGVYADFAADEAWWALYDSEGNMASVGMNELKLAEGDTYKLVYTIGF